MEEAAVGEDGVEEEEAAEEEVAAEEVEVEAGLVEVEEEEVVDRAPSASRFLTSCARPTMAIYTNKFTNQPTSTKVISGFDHPEPVS